MSLDASAPQRMIQAASAVGVRRRQRAQIKQSHGVMRRRSARVAGVGLGAFQAMPKMGLFGLPGKPRDLVARSGRCR